ADLTVTLSAPSTQQVLVQYATADGTATVAGGDYKPATGLLLFQPGQTTATVEVQAIDRFTSTVSYLDVNLSNPVGATIDPSAGTGVITINPNGQGTLSGEVYNDLNGNGSLDTGEPGLANWTVDLLDAASSHVLATAVTDSLGDYTFTGVAPGTYTVAEELQGGYTQTAPPSPPYSVTVAAGQTISDLNFGDFQDASITGTKYTDLTGNGFSGDDTPLGGVTIDLYQGSSASGSPFETTLTAGDGTYNFTNLGPGTYFVQESVPSGYTQTGGNAGYLVVVGSGVGGGGTSTGNNFDDFQNASITGTKYKDLTGNGFSSDDTPLGGVTIDLYQGSSATGSPFEATLTAGNGTYSFTNLTLGTYFVQESVPSGYTQTGGNAGYLVVVGPGALGSSGTSTGNNFDDFQNASITGTKYKDLTGDGFSSDDTPLGGVTIDLYQGSSATGTPFETAVTAGNGTYSFTNLTLGTYFVQETVPSGSIQTGGNAGYLVVVGPGGLGSGGTYTNANFDDYQQSAAI